MIVYFTMIGLAPLFVMICTCFLKISIVLVIVRNAMGIQQIPPTMAIYGIALALSLIVMKPVIDKIWNNIKVDGMPEMNDIDSREIAYIVGPLTEFMNKNTDSNVRDMFKETTDKLWEREEQNDWGEIVISVPTFVISEIQAAFKIGFLIYLPFLVVDILVSNILLALGMQMVSPMTISMPLKILLFVMADGWLRLTESLMLSYM